MDAPATMESTDGDGDRGGSISSASPTHGE